jgi:hypothetical protein
MTDPDDGGRAAGGDPREELRRRVRDEDPPPDESRVVLRGGPDTGSLILSHARRVNRAFVLDGAEVWAISVFVALDDVGPGSARGILQTKLRSYASVYLPTVGRLRQAGFEMLPTFARPHFSVLLPGLDTAPELFEALGELRINPYAGGQEPGGRE